MPRIIIAEDDKPTRDLCSIYLTSKDIEVEAYENGEKVLERMRSEKINGRTYDRVLTDYIMNGSRIDGLRLTRQIKEEFGIPVFMMSGSGIEKKAKEAGVAGYIPKPFNDLSDLDVLLVGLDPSQQNREPDYEQ
jgi:CheY-like chemotaxis protein